MKRNKGGRPKSSTKTRLSQIRWTIEAAASEFGLDRKTLTSRIKTSDILPGTDGKYSTRDMHVAIAGDLESARIRKTRVECEILERERDLASRLLIRAEDIEPIWEDICASIRQIILHSSLSQVEKEQVLLQLREIKPGEVKPDALPSHE